LACESLTAKGVGEPCAGEPHARFDRGPLGKASANGGVEPKHPKGKP
jgi:hypothetical protein